MFLKAMEVRLVVSLSGIVINGIAILALIDIYSKFQYGFATWGGTSSMAIPAAVSFLIAGTTFFCIGSSNHLWRTP